MTFYKYFVIVLNRLFMCGPLGLGVGAAADMIILGCQASGLLSEQGVAKNSSEGRGEHSGTETATDGVRGLTEEATKMASKGKNFDI